MPPSPNFLLKLKVNFRAPNFLEFFCKIFSSIKIGQSQKISKTLLPFLFQRAIGDSLSLSLSLSLALAKKDLRKSKGDFDKGANYFKFQPSRNLCRSVLRTPLLNLFFKYKQLQLTSNQCVQYVPILGAAKKQIFSSLSFSPICFYFFCSNANLKKKGEKRKKDRLQNCFKIVVRTGFATSQRQWKRLFRFPNFGRLIISCRNVSKNENILFLIKLFNYPKISHVWIFRSQSFLIGYFRLEQK